MSDDVKKARLTLIPGGAGAPSLARGELSLLQLPFNASTINSSAFHGLASVRLLQRSSVRESNISMSRISSIC